MTVTTLLPGSLYDHGPPYIGPDMAEFENDWFFRPYKFVLVSV